MAMIIFIRHGESEGNATEMLTGQVDVSLTSKGKKQAQQAAAAIKDLAIQKAFVSELRRALQTLAEMQKQPNLKNVTVVRSHALDERNFGSQAGRAKKELIQELGEDKFMKLVKGWDVVAHGGESLKMVYERTVPYFKNVILPEAQSGHNVLVVSHHQTLRALMKYLDQISDEDIISLKLHNAEAIIYEVDNTSGEIKKQLS